MQASSWSRGDGYDPEFLWKSKKSWPVVEELGSVFHNEYEVRRSSAVLATVVKNTKNPTDQLIFFFSDWTRLLTAVPQTK